MRHVSIVILLVLNIFVVTAQPGFGALKGAIDYSIPIDYKNLNEQELELKAEASFYNAIKLKDGVLNQDMTSALMLYNVLQNMNSDEIIYPIKLGILYDKLGKDRQAKGYFFKAIGIDKFCPKPYFYLGEFYYKRTYYRKALKYYNEAYAKGLNTDYDLLCKMGDVYEKLGDSRSALKYLQEAQKQSPNPDIDNKIRVIENFDKVNKEFYSETRIRK
jgi:tetratricopeptide (TPR) repeat protein